MDIHKIGETADRIIDELEKVIIGKRQTLQLMLAAILSQGGHILLEDYPGLAKTLIASSFSQVMGMGFKRIQFTPDLLPGDITGGYIYDSREERFNLRQGPIFTNVLLADEINRASPKTQSALLEAMQENQVTLEGETRILPNPFIVIATQNPIEYEGTFPLPEAQLDRFMLKLSIGYPEREEEKRILLNRIQQKEDHPILAPVIDPEEFQVMRNAIEEVYIEEDLVDYIVRIVRKTREYPKVAVGSSPRGSLALLKLSRSWAAIHGRNFVIPDDIKEFTEPTLAHRIVLDPSLWEKNGSEGKILKELTRSVEVPLLQKA